ncbi:MAG TPA: FdtA/QdtA family cupin domain-containing protein, partial [Chitinophagaceae bacterium]|nr:FdtA/QdtA family cupin domain-containing protein [Chitinophagaceae bacterium]
MNADQTIRLINFPRILDQRGNLSVVEQYKEIPFEIKRVYWIYDVPGGNTRWGHAFKESCEVIIAISGSFDVVLHDGANQHQFHLNRSYYGLYVPNLTWRHLENFSTNSLALVASSTGYS